MAKPTTSFQTDIAPMFAPFQANMMWRFNLGDYETVKANAQMIYGRLTGKTGNVMPAPPFTPLDQSMIDLYSQWMAEGCPP
jgi:hypothetical protein